MTQAPGGGAKLLLGGRNASLGPRHDERTYEKDLSIQMQFSARGFT